MIAIFYYFRILINLRKLNMTKCIFVKVFSRKSIVFHLYVITKKAENYDQLLKEFYLIILYNIKIMRRDSSAASDC